MRHKNNKQVCLFCQACNLFFWVSPCRESKAKYCSRRCAYKEHGRKVTKEDSNYLIDKKCEVCEENFQATKGNLKKGGGKFCSSNCYGKWRSKNIKGKLTPNWKGGITSQDKLERLKFNHAMRKLVFERDNYTCQLCFTRGGILNVDHIKRWAEFPELRFSLENCRTLCQSCHFFITFGFFIQENSRWGGGFLRS